ncbi:MAG: amidohydrolase [Gammaproteobacteria bacterium]|nr:amidohydrolase [Gammaproteobacteria bacterium]
MLKIDLFNHIWPLPFYERLKRALGPMVDITRRSEAVPMMTDLDERFRVMDRFGDYQQVLSLASPPLELIKDPKVSAELARIGNDGMQELCVKYPERFPGFIASLPMNDPDAAAAEIRRAVEDLGALGVQIYTNVAGKPLDAPEFRPLFEMMVAFDKPIWLHPARGANFPDYLTETRSLYEIWWTFGWPYETSVALARLVFSKIMQDLPELKVISHHAGGMVSFFEGRVGPGWDQLGARTSSEDYSVLLRELKRRPVDYFQKFYADTATFGSCAALVCALEFFGTDHIVFASDAPFDPEKGPMYIRETIKVIDSLDISDADRRKIYHGNAAKLTGLSVKS